MVEPIATVTLSIGSIFLFCYWFRYACSLILSAQTVREYAIHVAQANQLSFLETQVRLAEPSPNLDHLKNSLDRDYVVITNLLSRIDAERYGTEQRMLGIYYRLVGSWYQASRHISAGASCKALEEMSLILVHFADSIGEAAVGTA